MRAMYREYRYRVMRGQKVLREGVLETDVKPDRALTILQELNPRRRVELVDEAGRRPNQSA